MSGTGDCFVAAVAAMHAAVVAGAHRVLLVHGIPIGTGGDVEGIRHWHAWLEVLTLDEGWHVVDFSNGKQIIIAKRVYYRIGRLHERVVWRYSPDDVDRRVAEHGTAGPWVPNYEAMGA